MAACSYGIPLLVFNLISHEWAQRTTRRKIPYLRAPMYYPLQWNPDFSNPQSFEPPVKWTRSRSLSSFEHCQFTPNLSNCPILRNNFHFPRRFEKSGFRCIYLWRNGRHMKSISARCLICHFGFNYWLIVLERKIFLYYYERKVLLDERNHEEVLDERVTRFRLLFMSSWNFNIFLRLIDNPTKYKIRSFIYRHQWNTGWAFGRKHDGRTLSA